MTTLKKIGAVIGGILLLLLAVLGFKKKSGSKKKDQFIAKKHEVEKSIANIEGKEELIAEINEKLKEEIVAEKEKAKEISKKLEHGLEQKEEDMKFLKDFVNKYRDL